MANSILKTVMILLTLTTMVLTAKIPLTSPPADDVGVLEFKDFTIGILQFKGPIHGVYVELNGTVDEIYNKFSQMYPEVIANATLPAPYDPDFSELSAHGLAARNKGDTNCWPVQNWGPAYIPYLYNAINKLSVLGNGDCMAGAHQCTLLSCARGDGIWLCNDNYYAISPACPYLVSYAWDIVFKCTNTQTQLTGGQEFDTDNYNVIIRDHSCS